VRELGRSVENAHIDVVVVLLSIEGWPVGVHGSQGYPWHRVGLKTGCKSVRDEQASHPS